MTGIETIILINTTMLLVNATVNAVQSTIIMKEVRKDVH